MSRLRKLFEDLEVLKAELRILVREIDLVERAIRDVETDHVSEFVKFNLRRSFE